MLGRILILIAVTTGANCYQSSIIRPCAVTDIQCVRRLFDLHTSCNPNVRGWLPDAYALEYLEAEIPSLSASVCDTNFVVKNNNRCKISEYFHNLATNTTVLSLDCPGMTIESNRTLKVHVTKKEDQYYRYLHYNYMPLLQLTVNLRLKDNYDLCSAFIFAEITAKPTIRNVPQDQPTANFLASVRGDQLPVIQRELSIFVAKLQFKTYFNSYICDYGCNY